MGFVCARHFLGWDSPTLERAAVWVIDRHLGAHGEVDLDGVDLVVPGRRAGRGLLGMLVDVCTDRGLALVPPMILTPAELPSALIGVPGLHASSVAQKMAWVEALESMDRDLLTALVPDPPESDRFEDWVGFAGWVAGIARSVANEGMRMGEIPERVGAVLGDLEIQRWDVLGEVQSRYERRLGGLGVVDDRLVTLDRLFGDPPPTPKHEGRRLVLVGVPELGSIGRRAIERSGCAVDSLVFAPESMSDGFDALGSVVPDYWTGMEIGVDEDRIIFAQSPDEMCERALVELVVRSGAGSDGIDASSVVIGLGDESIIGTLRRKASLAGQGQDISVHAPTGIPATETTPGMLLGLMRTHLSEPSFDSLVALVRHPDFERALIRLDLETNDGEPSGGSGDRPGGAWWIESLDVIRQDHVLNRVTGIPGGIHPLHRGAIEFVLGTTRELLMPLDLEAEATLDQWMDRLVDSLGRIYGEGENGETDGDDRIEGIINGLTAAREAIDEIRALDSLGMDIPMCTGVAAIGLVLDRMGELLHPMPLTIGAIESVGWLELLHDPAGVCVMTGMSESCVPGSITHDPLLPGGLREALGMSTNTHRLARDSYLMSAINASRDAVFMCSRVGDTGEPMTPSRLLLRASGAQLAKRIRRFVDAGTESSPLHHLEIPVSCGTVDGFLPELRVHEGFTAPDSMAVTEFDAYLRSPAGWYLERRLGLTDLDTKAREISAKGLGTLVHSVLEAFGKDDSMRDLDDEPAIDEALAHLLDHQTAVMFGKRPAAAVVVQLELLRYRLRWFSRTQAQRRRDGWRIIRSEWSPDGSERPTLIVDESPVYLKGTIDRVDFHDATGRWAVIDYKTGRIQNPRRAHQRRDVWCKLQLPLYRMMVGQLMGDQIGDQEIGLGYMGLPATEKESALELADWDADELDSAEETARGIVREIRALEPGALVPMGESPPDSGHLGFITGQRFEHGGMVLDASVGTEDDERELQTRGAGR